MTSRRKRVLFARAADAANFNAQAKNIQHILRHWKSEEVRPSVFAFGDPDPGVAANPNVDIIRIRPDHLWRAAVWWQYQRDFDAVFCPGIHHIADWLALRARAASGRPLPIIATAEGLISVGRLDERERRYAEVAGHPVYGQSVPEARVRRIEWIMRNSMRILAISPFLQKQMTALYGDKVDCIPLGVDLQTFRGGPRPQNARPRVITAGNVQAHKRPELFVRLAERFPGADFSWYGSGDLIEQMTAEGERLGLSNLRFPGPVSPQVLANEMANSDVFVLTSMGEGVPKVTQEAAAAGLAQVIFGFYEAPTVINNRNGFVVWSDEEMLARVGQLLDNPELVSEMGNLAGQMAQDWSWNVLAHRWEECICSTVDGVELCDSAVVSLGQEAEIRLPNAAREATRE